MADTRVIIQKAIDIVKKDLQGVLTSEQIEELTAPLTAFRDAIDGKTLDEINELAAQLSNNKDAIATAMSKHIGGPYDRTGRT